MSIGAPSLATGQKREIPVIPGPPGPPFLLNSANNGLSVDPVTGKIVLGENIPGAGLADLLSDRFIELHGFRLIFDSVPLDNTLTINPQGFDVADNTFNSGVAIINLTGAGRIEITADKLAPGVPVPTLSFETGSANEQTTITDVAGVLTFSNAFTTQEYGKIDTLNQVIQFGELSGFFNASIFEINDPLQKLVYSTNGFDYLSLDVPAQVYALGDIGVTVNGTMFIADDLNQVIDMETGQGQDFARVQVSGGFGVFTVNLDDGTGFGFPVIIMDQSTGMFDFGQTSAAAGNNTFIRVDDPAKSIKLRTLAGDTTLDIEGYKYRSIISSNAVLETIPPGWFRVTVLNTVQLDFINSGARIINFDQANHDFNVRGQADVNTLFVDASTDRVGIGLNTPLEKLQVAGNIRLSGVMNVAGTVGFTGTVTPVVSITVVGGIVTNVA